MLAYHTQALGQLYPMEIEGAGKKTLVGPNRREREKNETDQTLQVAPFHTFRHPWRGRNCRDVRGLLGLLV